MKRGDNGSRLLFLTALLTVFTITTACGQLSDTTSQTANIASPALAQRLSFVTIGAKNLVKLSQFYTEKFGWTPLPGNKGIVFFKMNGFILALYPEPDMAKGAGITQDGTGFKRVTFTIYYPTLKAADEAFKTLQSRGVNIIKPPVKASWGGYVGYVADTEGNLWEIGYNPYVDLDKDGNTTGHH